MIKFYLLSFVMCFCLLGRAHEGHDMPGSLPPPPHGGRVGEAAHEHEKEAENSDHKGEGKEEVDEGELFIEAKLEGTLLKLYPLVLEPNNNKVFKIVKPDINLKLLVLKIEMPRSKQSKILNAVIVKDIWQSDIGYIKDKRILVYATLASEEENKTAKIQLER